MSNEQPKIPQATAKRLPLYYRFLKNLHASGKQRVSSAELSEAVKVDPATIRRDFSYFGALGKKGYGYNVNYLLSFFRQTLEEDEVTEVALFGVGNLGTAFLNYNFSKNNNTKIVMAFDVDERKVGTTVGGVPVYHLDELEERLRGDIPVAILTVPAAAAQALTDRLVAQGIKGILNFTPARLNVPNHIRVHHIDLAIELQSLVYFFEKLSIAIVKRREQHMKYLLLVLVILLLFGTKKLPELGRSFGQSLREFKDATKGLADDEETKTDR